MAVLGQRITDRYALYCGDALEVMPTLPAGCVHLSIYSPPFGGLYVYSSSERDLSNSRDYAEFFEHYAFVVRELFRLTMPGRMTAVHCMDIPSGNTGNDHLIDFPGDIIRLHEREGWRYVARYAVWKEPLGVRNRTMAKNLAHKTIVEDSSRCTVASADWLLVFRRKGQNPAPIRHPQGLLDYAGERVVPADLQSFRGWTGNQIENRYSHWIWRQYASAFWDDIRIGRVLPFRAAKDSEDEKHCLAAGSLVLTRSGYRPIETVHVGDQVLTHRARWRRVVAKRMNGVRKTVQVKAHGVPRLCVTPDHLLLCRSGVGPGRWEGSKRSTFHPRKWATKNAPEWMRSDETKGHYLNLPLPPTEQSPLSEADWWVIGRWAFRLSP